MRILHPPIVMYVNSMIETNHLLDVVPVHGPVV
jgi:hypothetical protein